MREPWHDGEAQPVGPALGLDQRPVRQRQVPSRVVNGCAHAGGTGPTVTTAATATLLLARQDPPSAPGCLSVKRSFAGRGQIVRATKCNNWRCGQDGCRTRKRTRGLKAYRGAVYRGAVTDTVAVTSALHSPSRC